MRFRFVPFAFPLAAALVGAPAAFAHTFDLASQMPPHLSLMFSMAWFGIEKTDPQGAGGDTTYANWQWQWQSSACTLTNDPATCTDFADAGPQRSIASRRRPQAGLYSASGRTPESLRRLDLNLSTLWRPCDVGARIDAFVPQLDSVQFTSAHPQNKQSATWDIAYRATVAYLDEADRAGLVNAVGIGIDSTTYWHFGSSYGLTTEAEREAALQADLADMATLAMAHPSALKLGGRPLFLIYVDSGTTSESAFASMLDGARAASGVDFYAVGTTLDSSYFAAFDALSPWVNLGLWASATGSTLQARAANWAAAEHDGLVSAVSGYPGREVFGGIAPGFDDYTEDWGHCTQREIPRDPAVMQGEFDYLTSERQSGAWNVRGLVFQTWDDWTEGTELEPDVQEGAAKLVQLRQLVGALFAQPADPAGDQAVLARWADFGQARDCCFAGGPCPDAGVAPVPLACAADGGPPDAGTMADAGEARDAGDGDAGPSAPDAGSRDAGSDGGATAPGADAGGPAAKDGGARDAGALTTGASGCGCGSAGLGPSLVWFWLALLGLYAWRSSARRRGSSPLVKTASAPASRARASSAS
ncbi:MAG: glycoside hydrolase family 71/99 protein [Deltaproteobacteria bacterium]